MKPKYIQLPPLPIDLPVQSIEMIWLYAQMSREEQIVLHEFMKNTINGNIDNLDKTPFVKMMQDDHIEMSSNIAEYINLMKELLGILISQACDMSGLVYQNYCIEGKSIEKISEEFNLDKKILKLITQYYDSTSNSQDRKQ